MVVWNVYYDRYDAEVTTIGIFTNLALAAREAMKYADDMLQTSEVLADIHKESYGFTIDIRKSFFDYYAKKFTFADTGQIVFARVELNHLS